MDFDAILSQVVEEKPKRGRKPKTLSKTEMIVPPESFMIWDPEQAISKLKEQFDPEIKALQEISETIQVTDEESEKQAVEFILDLKRFLKKFDGRRKRIIEKPGTFVSRINGFCRKVREIVEPMIRITDKKRTDYSWSEEVKRREREKKTQEEAKKLQEKIEAEAKKANVEAPEMPPVIPVEKPQTTVRPDTGGCSYINTEWRVTQILDYDQVPLDIKTFDLGNEREKEMFLKKANKLVEAGMRNIPGLEIKEVPKSKYRT